MFRSLLACVMTACLVVGGAAPTFASEAAPSASLVSKDGKVKAGKKGKKKAKKKADKKKKGKKAAAKKGTPKKGTTK